MRSRGRARVGRWRTRTVASTALLLDQAFMLAAASRGTTMWTKSLSVRYRRPVPLGTAIVVTAEIGEADGRRTPVTVASPLSRDRTSR